MLRLIGAVIAASLAAALPTVACGPDTDCVIDGGRTYRIAVPDGPGPYGAILFMHGYKGSAAGEMANGAMRDMARRLGVALIAPKSGGDDWLIRNAPHRGLTDDDLELRYFDALLADVTTRFAVDPQRILAAGFSAGGMMTWTLACDRADRFAAFVAISGTFWAPIPASCPSPAVDLVHIHGTADVVVPMTGRPVGDTRQGDVHAALAMFAAGRGYERTVTDAGAPTDLACTGAATAAGKELLLCLHGGGHEVDPAWLAWAYRRYVAGE